MEPSREDSPMRALPGALLGRMWPEERVVMGLRVCRWLREELLQHADRIVLRVDGTCFQKHIDVDPRLLHRDLIRFQHPEQEIVLQLVNEGVKGAGPYRWRNWSLPESYLLGLVTAIPAKLKSVLTHLDLRKCKIGARGAAWLEDVLGQCESLSYLNLSSNELGSEGAERLSRVLGNCVKLSTLNLSINEVGPAGTRRLALALQHCWLLTHLHFSWNRLGPEGAWALVPLRNCRRLVALELSDNNLGDAGAKWVCEVIAGRRSGELSLDFAALQDLDLSWNRIGMVGSATIAAMLPLLPSLQRLDLGFNCIGDEGARSICAALESCGLQNLNLHGNRLNTDWDGGLLGRDEFALPLRVRVYTRCEHRVPYTYCAIAC